MTQVFPIIAEVASGVSVPPDWTGLENAWIVGLFYLGLAVAGLVVDIILLARFFSRPPEFSGQIRRFGYYPWTWRDALHLTALLVVLHAVGILAYGVLHKLVPASPDSESVAMVFIQSLVFHWAGLALVVGLMSSRNLKWGNAFGMRARRIWRDIGLGITWYMATLPFLLFYTWLYQLGLRYVGYEPTIQEVVWIITGRLPGWVRIYLLMLGVFLAPLVEELIFRGIALPVFARRMGVPGAVFAVSALFALMHFHWASLVPLFVIAVAFSLAYIQSESIIVPMTMHAVFNGINLGMLFVLRGSL